MERLGRGDWSRRVRSALPEAIEDCMRAYRHAGESANVQAEASD
jgi:hypothetical protein